MIVKVVTDLNVRNKEIRVTNHLFKNLFSNKCSDRGRRKKKTSNITYLFVSGPYFPIEI